MSSNVEWPRLKLIRNTRKYVPDMSPHLQRKLSMFVVFKSAIQTKDTCTCLLYSNTYSYYDSEVRAAADAVEGGSNAFRGEKSQI